MNKLLFRCRPVVWSCMVLLSPWLAMKAGAQTGNTLQFIENKGQWVDSVLFSADMQQGGFYLRKGGYDVLQVQYLNAAGQVIPSPYQHASEGGASPLAGPAKRVNYDVYSVKFLGASENPLIVPEKIAPNYINYFIGNDRSKWASHCRVFQAVEYKDLYPGVDVRYYSQLGALKYTLIIHPGADLSQVRLQYNPISRLYVKNGQLHVATPVGETVELTPDAFQPNDSGRTQVSCRYKVSGNTMSFSVSGYDPGKDLVIDPTFIFCSFTGSRGDNWGFTATYGADGSMYLGGISQAGYLTTPGAYSPGFHGGSMTDEYPPDIAIIKLTPKGTAEVWASYLGGATNEELPTSMIENHAGNLVIVGRTLSTDFPNNTSIGPRGGWDIFLTEFSNDGSKLIGSIVMGGTGQDGANITDNYDPQGAVSLKRNYGDDSRGEVIVDGNDNIYMVSCTRSTDFPVQGAFQTTNNGGANGQDGLVIKADPTCNVIQWDSYIGGTGDDAAYVIDKSPITGSLLIAGGTYSTDFPGNTAGVVQPANGGSIDGFISMLTDNGGSVSLNKTTYIGTSAIDQIYGLQYDQQGFPYITGTTFGTWPLIAPPGVTGAQFYNAGNAKQFIAKLQPDLSAYVYSTTFGTAGAASPNLSPVAFLVDRCQNVYVSGWGGIVNSLEGYPNAGTNGLPITPDAVQPHTDGSDFYFFVMKKNATGQLYGSWFGQAGGRFQEHVDGGTSRFDQNGVIYQAICANCYGGAIFPTGPIGGVNGVFAPNNGTNPSATNLGGCNEAGVKIAFNLAGVGSGVKALVNGNGNRNVGCVPMGVTFLDTIADAKTYIWNFGDGSAPDTTTVPTTGHTYTTVGTYQIMLISVDSTSCNVADTSYALVRAENNSAAVGFTDAKVGPCQSLTFQFTNTSVPGGGFAFTNTSFVWDFGDGSAPVTAGTQPQTHAYAAPGDYTVRLILVDTTFCNAPDTVSLDLRIAPNVVAGFVGPTEGCAPFTAVFTDTSVGGAQWAWTFGDGGTSNLESPTHLYPNPGTYTIKLVVTDPNTCNKVDSATSTLVLATKPTAAFSWGPQPAQQNTPAVFTNNSSPDAVSFVWYFGDGDSLATTSRDTVTHQYIKTGSYNACLVAINAEGCSDTVCQTVNAEVFPDVDVPNAFTPGRFGADGVIMVRGYAIAKMEWRIYNRWGQMVFESQDINSGWDGNFKGQPQPMDVYAYTLSVEFSDGTKATKTGDITLLR